MREIYILVLCVLMTRGANGFSVDPSLIRHNVHSRFSTSTLCALSIEEFDFVDDWSSLGRRDMIAGLGLFSGVMLFQSPAIAIPMVTADEFSSLMRDSSLSIQIVEFSGTRNEVVTVRLVDGTTFGIKDVVESSTDPRSPLKVAAACRENGVKTKFVDLESILAKAPKKKKMYTNQRVQEAQEKERERQERIRLDEEERLAQVRKMQMDEEARISKSLE